MEVCVDNSFLTLSYLWLPSLITNVNSFHYIKTISDRPLTFTELPSVEVSHVPSPDNYMFISEVALWIISSLGHTFF